MKIKRLRVEFDELTHYSEVLAECDDKPLDGRADLLALIERGWRATYAELFGQSFVDALDSAETDDRHHSEAIGWHWAARLALLRGRRPPNDEFAYFPIWARGNNKTTIAEAMVCVDAVLSYAYDQPGFCLYIGSEKEKVKRHLMCNSF